MSSNFVQQFVKSIDNAAIKCFELHNAHGMSCVITNYGATLLELLVPNRDGAKENVVMNHATLHDYQQPTNRYFGATVGRYANRIENGVFHIGSQRYELERNNKGNALHGGSGGFHAKVWHATRVNERTLRLNLLSPDMDQGYPGELNVTVTYTIASDKNALSIDYSATTTRTTVVNLTNHSYFNLSGKAASEGKTILDHVLTLNARHYTPVNETLIPTGEILKVENTALDFTKPMTVGSRINDPALAAMNVGYDHNFVLCVDRSAPRQLTFAALLEHPASGRAMRVHTTEPGIQLYTSNYLAQKHIALCLETQHFPNSPNTPHFPSTLLYPGDTYRTTTIYAFEVTK